MAEVRQMPLPSYPAILAAILSRPPVPRAKELPNLTFQVENFKINRAKAQRFNELIGFESTNFTHPAFLFQSSFPLTLAVMARPSFPLPVIGLSHIANEFLLHRPLAMEQNLTLELRLRSLKPHPRGRTFEAVSVFIDQFGIAAVNVATYLARGSYAQFAGMEHGIKSQAEVQALDNLAASELEFEPPQPHLRWDLSSKDSLAYARIFSNSNPIHLSNTAAKIFGFPKAIAPAMYVPARGLSAAGLNPAGLNPARLNGASLNAAELNPAELNAAGFDLYSPFNWRLEFKAPITLASSVWLNFKPGENAFSYQAFAPRLKNKHTGAERKAQLFFSSHVQKLT